MEANDTAKEKFQMPHIYVIYLDSCNILVKS